MSSGALPLPDILLAHRPCSLDICSFPFERPTEDSLRFNGATLARHMHHLMMSLRHS
jgi:hypothetical protein